MNTATHPTIQIDREYVRELERATRDAGRDRVQTFTFRGSEFVVGYAEYLLEHMGISTEAVPV